MQLANVVAGFLTGLPVLVAVGPIALLLIELGLERGVRGGSPAALGVAAGDTAFAVLAAVAGTALSAALSSVGGWLRLVAAVVLVGVAVRLVRSVGGGRRGGEVADGSVLLRVRGPRLAAGFLGLTMVNPLTIVVYAGIVVSGGTGVGTAGWVLGMGLASLAVHGGFVGLGHLLGATVPDRALAWLRVGAAAALVGLALHLALG